MDVQETIKKLDLLQKKADEIKSKKNKLEGEEEAAYKRLKELEERSLKEIGVPVDELQNVVDEYTTKVENYTSEIEKLLGNK